MEKEKYSHELTYAAYAPDTWRSLNNLLRTGWVNRGIKDPESVQEHIINCRDLVISLFDQLTEFSEKDIEDILHMLEVHDWPEALVGDQVIITKDEALSKKLKEEKYREEKAAMSRICKNLGETGAEIFALWLRYEEGRDPATLFARQVDKYQAIEKAFEYEQKGERVSTQEFIDHVKQEITHPVLMRRIAEIKKKLRNN